MNLTLNIPRSAAALALLAIVGTSPHAAEPETPWRQRAAAAIDTHRKATLTVEVVDEHGFAVPGVGVKVRQTQHEFSWGFPSTPSNAPSPLFNTLRVGGGPASGHSSVADALKAAAGGGRKVHATWTGKAPLADEGHGWADVAGWELPRSSIDAERVGLVRSLRRASPFARLFWPCGDVSGHEGAPTVAAARREALQLGQQGFGVDGLVAELRPGNHAAMPEQWSARLDEGAGTDAGGTPLTWHVVARLPGPEVGAFDSKAWSDLLWIAFAHPAVTGISVAANEGNANPLVGPGGLTPAGIAWSNLVCVAWTTLASTRTSQSGMAGLRVFRGEHDVSVEHGGIVRSARARVSADAVARVVVPVTRPVLVAEPGEWLRFAWPASATGYVLESASDPDAGPWARCDTFAVRGRDAWRQEVGHASATRYFRLRRGGDEPR